MKCSEIIEILELLAPRRCACDWDNPGLLAGRKDKEVKKILITVDVDDQTVEKAAAEGVDMIISHHPLIFKAMKHITDEDFIGRRLVKMIQADISYFAMHTNFDSAPGCMADVVAERLGIVFGAPLEELGEENGVEDAVKNAVEGTAVFASGFNTLQEVIASGDEGINKFLTNANMIKGGAHRPSFAFLSCCWNRFAHLR